MAEPGLEPTDRVLAQGKALARAIAALETTEPLSPLACGASAFRLASGSSDVHTTGSDAGGSMSYGKDDYGHR